MPESCTQEHCRSWLGGRAMSAFPWGTVPQWPPSRASPGGNSFLSHPGQPAGPTSPHHPGPHPFPGNPALSQPREPATALGHLNGRCSSSAPSRSSPQALYSAACPTTTLPCLTHTSCLRASCSPVSLAVFSHFFEVPPPPENNHLGLHPDTWQPPCRCISSTSRPSRRGSSGQPLPHSPLLCQPLTLSSGLLQQPAPAITVPSGWAGLGQPWWGNGCCCLETPRGTASPAAAAAKPPARDVKVLCARMCAYIHTTSVQYCFFVSFIQKFINLYASKTCPSLSNTEQNYPDLRPEPLQKQLLTKRTHQN